MSALIRGSVSRFAVVLLSLATSSVLSAAPQYRIHPIPEIKTMHPRTAAAINERNVVAGGGVVSVADRQGGAYLASRGGLTALPGIDSSYQVDIADVNKHNVVVGNINGEAMMWASNGTPLNLNGLIGCGRSVAAGVNDAGVVVGTFSCLDPDGLETHDASFAFHDGVLTQIGDFGKDTTYINGINNAGQLVGTFGAKPDSLPKPYHASIWQGGERIDLGTLGGPRSSGWAINAKGHVIGQSEDEFHQWNGFLHDGVSMKPLTSCAGRFVYPMALNEHDQIIGYYTLDDGTLVPFLIDQGRCQDLNVLLDDSRDGWTSLLAMDINDAGVIVGTGSFGGRLRAFVATPIRP